MNSIKIKQRFFEYLGALDRKVFPHESGLLHSILRLGKSMIASLPAANAFPFPQILSLEVPDIERCNFLHVIGQVFWGVRLYRWVNAYRDLGGP